MTAAVQWDPVAYGHYADERSRPFLDLLARVGADQPRLVVDLGCGPGTLTALLAERWPHARVLGVDSSPDMIATAASRAVPGRLDFHLEDVRSWSAAQPVDVLVSNATLQWVPDHLELLPRLVDALAPGGWLAVQVPGNADAPSHALLTELRRSPRWRDRLAGTAELVSHEPVDYLERLLALGCAVDVWETTYLHVLAGDNPVLGWVGGTALRPVLAALTEPEQAEFRASYSAALAAAYPRRPYGTLLPFRRVFLVARRPAAPGGRLDG